MDNSKKTYKIIKVESLEEKLKSEKSILGNLTFAAGVQALGLVFTLIELYGNEMISKLGSAFFGLTFGICVGGIFKTILGIKEIKKVLNGESLEQKGGKLR